MPYKTAPLQNDNAIEKLHKKVSQIPILGTTEKIELPLVSFELSERELIKAIEKAQLENDLIAVNAGKMTFHIVVSELKKVGIINIISNAVQLIVLLLKMRTIVKE